LTVEACAAVRAAEVLPAVRELRPGDRGTTAAGVAFEVLATGLRLTCDPWCTGVAWTRQRLGGRRAWFECGPCGRRAGVLFSLPNGAGGYACRKCHGLTYRSRQRWNKRDRPAAWLAAAAALLAQL